MKTTRDMSDRHEIHLADVLDGRRTRGSGNQSRDQGDVKQSYGAGEFVFCGDGKSTLHRSISVSLADWEKITEQAHWARPLLPLRFYASLRGDEYTDLVVCSLDDFAAMQDAANQWFLNLET